MGIGEFNFILANRALDLAGPELFQNPLRKCVFAKTLFAKAGARSCVKTVSKLYLFWLLG
jgi:hypothetical protein